MRSFPSTSWAICSAQKQRRLNSSEAEGQSCLRPPCLDLHAGFGGFLYVAAKHAITGLTRQLAIELAPHIRVNAVAPGYVPTRLAGLQTLDQGESKSGAGRTADQFLLQASSGRRRLRVSLCRCRLAHQLRRNDGNCSACGWRRIAAHAVISIPHTLGKQSP